MATASGGSGTRLQSGWRALIAWGLVGGVLVFSAVTAASVGLFVLPVALIASATVVKRLGMWPGVAGAFEGAAAVVFCFGVANLGSRPPRSEPLVTTLRQDSYRVAGVVLFVVAAVLLTSVGGLGIVAGPVTLPLLFLAVRAHPTRPFRVAGSVIGGLTAAELSWGMLYVMAGEMPVLSWLLPVAAGLATGVVFVIVPPRTARTQRNARRE